MNFFSEASTTFRNATQRRKKDEPRLFTAQKNDGNAAAVFIIFTVRLLSFYKRRIRPHKLVEGCAGVQRAG